MVAVAREKFREDIYVRFKEIIPPDMFKDEFQPERSIDMMTQHIKFSDLLDASRSANKAKSYEEVPMN